MSFNCTVEGCGTTLESGDTDSRQEWTKEEYYCPECEAEYERMITYKAQSSLVESDEIERTKEPPPKKYLVGIVLNYGITITAENKEQAKELALFYLSHPIDLSTDKEKEEGNFDIEDIKCCEREICLCERQ